MADNKETTNRETGRSYAGSRSTPARRHYREGESLSSSGLERLRPGTSRYQPSPFTVMRRLAEDMDHIFSDYGLRGTPLMGTDLWSVLPAQEQSLWTPQIETFRRGDDLVVRADLPGMNKDNVNIEIEDDALIISGERQDEFKEERDQFYRTERSYGRFYRTVPLPDGVDPNACNAKFNDGVLEVTVKMPKEPEQKRRRIDIK